MAAAACSFGSAATSAIASVMVTRNSPFDPAPLASRDKRVYRVVEQLLRNGLVYRQIPCRGLPPLRCRARLAGPIADLALRTFESKPRCTESRCISNGCLCF
jgi:hypothetical protein